MSAKKRENAKNDFFAFYVGRPLTYVLTIPFLYTNISPNTITLISIIPTILGFIFFSFGSEISTYSLGWFSFFLWSMLDGIDGNVARYKKIYSKIGDTLDAPAGYFAMVFIFFGAGIAASKEGNHILGITPSFFIILGGLSSIFTILPRLVMHKAMNSIKDTKNQKLNNRGSYNLTKVIALNVTSIPGMVQILLLICSLTQTLKLYTIFYFLINLFVMIISIKSILLEELK